MKIFVIPSGYPNKYNKNSCIYIHEQIKKLQSQDVEIVILDASAYRVDKWMDKNCFKIERKTFEGVNIISLHYFGLMQSRLPRLNMLLYNIQLKSIYKKAVQIYGKPDILHAHFSFLSGYATYKLSKQYNIPYIVTEHYSLFLQQKLNKYIKKITYITIENAEKFICVSDTLRKAVIRHTNTEREIDVVPNMISEQYVFHEKPIKNCFKFFSAGNLVKSKGFNILIEAFCKSFDVNDKIILYIGGQGSEYSNLSNLISLKKRDHQIILLGQLTKNKMLEEYIECDCFVLPSRYETFGIVYREALAVGRPIISTKNGGIEEGWHDSFGKLIEVDDINGLSNAMKYMVNNIVEFDCKRISKQCLEYFYSDYITNQILKIYMEGL